jgi:hypothetical protein
MDRADQQRPAPDKSRCRRRPVYRRRICGWLANRLRDHLGFFLKPIANAADMYPRAPEGAVDGA